MEGRGLRPHWVRLVRCRLCTELRQETAWLSRVRLMHLWLLRNWRHSLRWCHRGLGKGMVHI